MTENGLSHRSSVIGHRYGDLPLASPPTDRSEPIPLLPRPPALVAGGRGRFSGRERKISPIRLDRALPPVYDTPRLLPLSRPHPRATHPPSRGSPQSVGRSEAANVRSGSVPAGADGFTSAASEACQR